MLNYSIYSVILKLLIKDTCKKDNYIFIRIDKNKLWVPYFPVNRRNSESQIKLSKSASDMSPRTFLQFFIAFPEFGKVWE